ncbi:uncharacterized protein LOC108628031 isoform X2 [Ceratina calcarata]|uniref:Uncharacterized protein LOC108628031 isoform X2 n=1 Tax=Ceratina calcarata TaxID=156304 RepID=A0AAJ7S777_9HYME|nr:uncharacterized protein LOC108628031 isoform X2 [Ceratina calcarata]
MLMQADVRDQRWLLVILLYHNISDYNVKWFRDTATVKRRLGLDRTSVFSTHGSMDGACTTGSEGNDTELKLLYDQYMQNLLTKEILKRRQQEKMHLFFIQLATIAKECNDLKEKLFKLKIRERDIMNLTKIQTAIDSQIADTNNCTLKEDIQPLESTLSQLYSHIKPFDVLRVSNMVLPETTEEWSNMRETMESCSETLKSIIDIIGLRKESYENVSKGVKEFIHIFDDIKEHHQRLEKEIPNLQFLVLKGASLALMEDHN